jgi:dual specificity tyrosine-phosphorylation-regulated kinase 2/3/4
MAMVFMREQSVVHCDLKPENIVLCDPNKTGIKIIDFGSSTYEASQYYTYIQSRYYRAPEIMLGIRYTPAIDMWSLGCVLYELLVGLPLFIGEDEKDQMNCIIEVKGLPPRSMIVMASRRDIFFDDDYKPRQTTNTRNKVRQVSSKRLERLMHPDGERTDFVDFVDRCLEWKPEKRMTPMEAFEHKWITDGLWNEFGYQVNRTGSPTTRQSTHAGVLPRI